jgi:hypothetical protein
LQVQLRVHRDVALEVGGAVVDALDPPLPGDCAHDVQGHVDIRSREPHEIETAADAEHLEPRLGHRFHADEVEDVVGPSRQEVADGLDGFGLRGVDDIGRAESAGGIESLVLDVDDDDPRRPRDARAADGVEPDPTGADHDYGIARADVRGVQDRACARDHAAAKQCGLRERKRLGYDDKLVLVDQHTLGEARKPEALVQRRAQAAEPRRFCRSTERRIGVAALKGAPREASRARPARL